MDKRRIILTAAVIGLIAAAVATVAVLFIKPEDRSHSMNQPAVQTQTNAITSTGDNNAVDEREFLVNVQLAPLGYHVSGDYVLEVARAENVHSDPTSRFDRSDTIDYSAAVIDGRTKIRLTDGEYVVCIYPEGQPENFKRYNWRINKDTMDKDLVLIVTEKIQEGQVMIVLKWGEMPSDIDGHLVGQDEHVKPLDPQGAHAHLDTDSRNGNGIECITITDLDGKFSYLVNNWSSEVPLGESHAQVLVFSSESSQPLIFEVPEHIQNVWDAFTIENGVVQEVGLEGRLDGKDNPLPAN